jgi:hypothetical protein
MRGWRILLIAVLALTGCKGAKDSCEESAKSYYSLLTDHNWSGIFEMLTPEFKKKVGTAERLDAHMGEIYKGTKSFSVNFQNFGESKTGVCIVNGTLSYTIRLRGQNPVPIDDEYFAWTFKKGRDGLWYIDLPGEEKLMGY